MSIEKFKREARFVFHLFKESTIPIGIRLVTVTAKTLTYSYISSKQGDDFFSKSTLAALNLSGYYVGSEFYYRSISVIGERLKNDPDGLSAANYFFAGCAFSVVQGVVLSAPAIIAGYALKLDEDMIIYAWVSIPSLSLQFLKTFERQGIYESQYVWLKGFLTGRRTSFLTTVVDAGIFFGLSWVLVPNLGMGGFAIAAVVSSSAKLTIDTTYIYLSGQLIRRPVSSEVWKDFKFIFNDGYKFAGKTAIEASVFLWTLPIYAHMRGKEYLAALQIAYTCVSLASPFTALFRGMQLLWRKADTMQEKVKIGNRSIIWTFIVGGILTSVLEPIPRQFGRLFTHNETILNTTASIMPIILPGELVVYPVRSIADLISWELFSRTWYPLGVSAATTILFYLITLPIYLEHILGFEFTVDTFVGALSAAALAMLVRHVCLTNTEEYEEVEEIEQVEQGENMQCCGIFKYRDRTAEVRENQRRLLTAPIPDEAAEHSVVKIGGVTYSRHL